jgi:hypothetical protein
VITLLHIAPLTARQRLGKHIPTGTNTHATTELLDAVLSMQFMLYQILNM